MVEALPDGLPNLLRGARRCLEPREVEVRLGVFVSRGKKRSSARKKRGPRLRTGRGRVPQRARKSSDSAPSDDTRKRDSWPEGLYVIRWPRASLTAVNRALCIGFRHRLERRLGFLPP